MTAPSADAPPLVWSAVPASLCNSDLDNGGWSSSWTASRAPEAPDDIASALAAVSSHTLSCGGGGEWEAGMRLRTADKRSARGGGGERRHRADVVGTACCDERGAADRDGHRSVCPTSHGE